MTEGTNVWLRLYVAARERPSLAAIDNLRRIPRGTTRRNYTIEVDRPRAKPRLGPATRSWRSPPWSSSRALEDHRRPLDTGRNLMASTWAGRFPGADDESWFSRQDEASSIDGRGRSTPARWGITSSSFPC